MKYSEFIKLIKKNGWVFYREGKGSHEIWKKGEKQEVVPNHGAKEMPKGLERTLKKRMDLK